VPGQPPYPLTEAEKNKLRSPNLPDAYWIDVTRDEKGDVAGIVINQPEGRFTFNRVKTAETLMSVDDLLARMIEAYGGEASLRKHNSSTTKVEVDFENQGVQGEGVISARAPNLTASDIRLTALNKQIGTVVSYFDGNSGGETLSFGPDEIYSGKRLEDIRTGSDFYDVLNWKKNYNSIVVKRMAKIGDDDAYVVQRKCEKGTPVTDYVSAKSFLVLKRDLVISSETAGIELPQTEVFSDYRSVDGVMVPFKIVSNNIANGDVVLRVKELKFDQPMPDSVFKKPVKK